MKPRGLVDRQSQIIAEFRARDALGLILVENPGPFARDVDSAAATAALRRDASHERKSHEHRNREHSQACKERLDRRLSYLLHKSSHRLEDLEVIDRNYLSSARADPTFMCSPGFCPKVGCKSIKNP